MPNNECIPFLEPADRPTGHCSAVVRGKRFVVISATPPGGMAGTENPRVAEAGAGGHAYAVSCYDGALDEEIPLIRGNSIVPVVCGAALTAGQAVQSDAQGRAIPLAAGAKLGVAAEDQSTVDADVGVAINL